jgi:hypothetical protein
MPGPVPGIHVDRSIKSSWDKAPGRGATVGSLPTWMAGTSPAMTIEGTRGTERMDKLRIVGGKRLSGEIPIGGAKNAALPLMAASLLTDQELTLRHVPRLADIDTMTNLLVQHGVTVTLVGANGKNGNGHANGNGKRAHGGGMTMRLKADDVGSTVAPYDLVRKMRASVLVLGPLVARTARPRCRCPAAAPSARGRLTCT